MLQEAADGGIDLKPDGAVIGFARLVVCAGPGQKMRPRRPIGLVLRERSGVDGVQRGEARVCALSVSAMATARLMAITGDPVIAQQRII